MADVAEKRWILLVLVTFAVIAQGAFAAPRLNISMQEIVYQNVTFGENFILENRQNDCIIHGTLNASNPSGDNVFNTYIELTNIDKLTTDFYYTAGRVGIMFSGGATQQEVIGADIDGTVNDYTLGLDLDNDGEEDYAYVNSTHFIFNLSSEASGIAIRFFNSTGNVDIDAGSLDAPIDMTEVAITGTRDYGNITIVGTTTVADTLQDAEIDITINEYAQSPILLHIPELRGGESILYSYNMSCMGVNPPVQIDTTYANADHPGINKKVLAGYNWTINQTVSNINPAQKTLANLNITMRTQGVIWNTSTFSFAFVGEDDAGDAANLHQIDDYWWWWAPNGGTLNYNENTSVRYNMTAPFSVPFSATYLALMENISYSVEYLLSNLTIAAINASADLEFSEEKRIYQPSDNELNPNVTWEVRPDVHTDIDISYDLFKVTLWVTSTNDPNDYSGLNVTHTGSPLAEINLTDSWGSSDYWWFNFTDGSNATNPPPIVWIKPEWLISNKLGQLLNYSLSVNGNDLYMKYVYVVNGYWLEITKNITSIDENIYRINVTVENIGNGWTPIYERVTVYDFVPIEFHADNFSDTTYVNESVGALGSDYYGMAYKWDIPWKEDMNSSLGPKNGPDATGLENHTWTVAYNVTGSGSYKVTELYIVGLDPLKVDGASASPIITIIAGIQTHTKEIMYVSIIAFLIILNVTNLVITHRINAKISQRLPPPPVPNRHAKQKT